MQIAELRRKAGLTQVELARKAGVSVASIRAYEQGINKLYNMEIKNAVAIATALGEDKINFYREIVSMLPN